MYKSLLFVMSGVFCVQAGMYPALENVEGGSVLESQPKFESRQKSLYADLLKEVTDGDDGPKEEFVKPSQDAVDPQGGGSQVDDPDGGGCWEKIQCCAQVGECCCEGVKCAGCTTAATIGCLSSTGARCLAGGRRLGEWFCALF